MTTAFNEYIQQFTRQSQADDTEWRKATEARTLMNLINQRTAGATTRQVDERKIITTHFGIHACIVPGTDGNSVRAVYAPRMGIINIPLVSN